ncbi:MAG: hypothetical protein NC300_12000 [Bacteroidales bacterium]|nr:hypothetical protein [Clostridium sp.]MCM1204854.1 hypothetical protein [Bacteroidales bacterium]
MKKIIGFLLCLFMGTLIGTQAVRAAVPRVMVSDYSIKEKEVVAGEEFTLTVVLKNTAAKAVKNLKLSVYAENGELLPAEGAGTAYVNQIDAGAEEEFTFSMQAISGLEEKSYKLALKTEFESSGGQEYTVDEMIFIPISLKQRLSVTDIYMAEDFVELGDTVEISASVNNLGDGALYHVSAEIKGESLQEEESYIGTVEPGKSGMLDVLTKAVALSDEESKNQIIISYEDRKGNVYKEEVSLMVFVEEPIYENLEKIKDTPDYSGTIKRVFSVAVVVIIILLIIFWMIQKRKRKQKILDEF